MRVLATRSYVQCVHFRYGLFPFVRYEHINLRPLTILTLHLVETTETETATAPGRRRGASPCKRRLNLIMNLNQ